MILSLALLVTAAGCTSSPPSQKVPPGSWVPLPPGPAVRLGHVAAWTGKQMLVWGGQVISSGKYRPDGAAYDPVARTWSPIPDAPLEPRNDAAGVWTGAGLLVWGGSVESQKGAESFGDGASYDPISGRWTKLPPSPLDPRFLHTPVWTGSRLLIWGGARIGRRGTGGGGPPEEAGRLLSDGAMYDPGSGHWTLIEQAPLRARVGHVAVWTGREMLVWGGATLKESTVAFADGAAYNPATNRWRTIGVAPVRPGATFASVWTGKQMLVWGGPGGEGAAYDPSTDRWTRMPRAPLSSLSTPTAVWTGRVMLLWGQPEEQKDPQDPISEGAAYDPVAGLWTRLPAAPSAPGQGQTAVWTGRTMLVWGGYAGTGPFSGGAAFTLGTTGG